MQRFTFVIVLIFAVVQQAPASSPGKAAAMKYFTKKRPKTTESREPAAQVVRQSVNSKSYDPGHSRLLALAVGSLINSKNYQWTEEQQLSGWNGELFYQDASEGYFGHGYHLELQKYAAFDEEFSKISFLFSFTFPRRLSFPVYLGVAGGPGYFTKQLRGESAFSFDYKAYVGFRLNEVYSQYFVQAGIKNHIHVLSDGQFIGWFVSSGVAYRF